MIGTPLARHLLACALAAVAGYVDAVGYLHLGGAFVSFMSGNSTRLGVGIGRLDPHLVVEGVSIIACFVVGAGLGEVVVGRGATWRRRLLLVIEAVLLGASPLAAQADLPLIAIAGVTVAMGMENALFQSDARPSIGLTYVTGALVKLGQKLIAAVSGGSHTAWLAELGLWVSLTLGAAAGTVGYDRLSLSALWVASGVCLVLAAGLGIVWPRRPETAEARPEGPKAISDPGPSRA